MTICEKGFNKSKTTPEVFTILFEEGFTPIFTSEYRDITLFKNKNYKMNKKKITYIFGGGRKKIEYGGEFAEDMFYGYFGLNEKYDVQIYETIKADFKIYKFLAKFLNKLTGLGFHFENSLKKQDKKNIYT